MEIPILYYFDPNCHIQIEIDVLNYAIIGILSQHTSDELNRWHLVIFFSWKMILIDTQYNTHNSKLLTIIEVFQTCCHYLEGCKYEVLMLINYNNLHYFMRKKTLSSKQVCLAQELS